MKVYKIIANKRPSNCLVCPIARQQKGKCGKTVKESNNGLVTQYKVPDNRCIIEIKIK
jgi:hypothetical protein